MSSNAQWNYSAQNCAQPLKILSKEIQFFGNFFKKKMHKNVEKELCTVNYDLLIFGNFKYGFISVHLCLKHYVFLI